MTKDKEAPSPAPTPAHVPMPDLTSQPLDPNEPTYCLCQQVSFGEMIGCDNEDVSQRDYYLLILVSEIKLEISKWPYKVNSYSK